MRHGWAGSADICEDEMASSHASFPYDLMEPELFG
jgi:hypothetical protein